MAHGQPASPGAGRVGRVLTGRVLAHTTHGQPALVLPALVLRGQRS